MHFILPPPHIPNPPHPNPSSTHQKTKNIEIINKNNSNIQSNSSAHSLCNKHADANHVDVHGHAGEAPLTAVAADSEAMLLPPAAARAARRLWRGAGVGEEEEPVAGPVRRRARRRVRLPRRVLGGEAGGGPAAAGGPGEPVRVPAVPGGVQPGAGQPGIQGAARRAAGVLRGVRRGVRERALLPGGAAAAGQVPRGGGGRGGVGEGEAGVRDVQERQVRRRLRPRRRLARARRVHPPARSAQGKPKIMSLLRTEIVTKWGCICFKLDREGIMSTRLFKLHLNNC